jgi:aminomethyltransferase
MDAVSIAAEPTALYQWHAAHCPKSRLAGFAGYLMPLWFSSIAAEHLAVRKTAGLFDCTHMGVMDVAGRDAAEFLNVIATNEIGRLADGAAQYSYILDDAGNALDDIIVYRQGGERFMVVVNAANKAKIAAYVREKNGSAAAIRFLDNADTGKDARVDIALQGPASVEVISSLLVSSHHP